MTGTDGESDATRSKVGRLIAEYDLDGLGAELEERWTAEGDERASLRDLAADFNRELLDARLAEAGVDAVDADGLYRRLTDDEVSGGVRTRAERRLEREGVDVSALRSDFVSYQAIRTYLREYRDAEYEGPDTDRVEQARESIGRLRSRTQTVAESKLERLAGSDEIGIESPRVLVDVRVLCESCGERYEVGELLDGEGCDCSE